MMEPRIVFEEEQEGLPLPTDEQEQSDHDVKYLLTYLARQRNESYALVERPDERERKRAAPDYLFRETRSGRTIAIERARLMRQDLRAVEARLIKGGAQAVMIGSATTIDPSQIAGLLAQAIAQKTERGQLHGVEADERILLLRNRLLATATTFLRAPIGFTDREKGGVDHAYLIASSRLLRLW